jgi:three-Cys-motif partner protein
LDLFAGTGLNYSLLRSVEIPGSPLILLDAEPPPATKVLLCEQHDGARQALVNRYEAYGARADIHAGDANAVVHGMLTKVPKTAPAFAFLDRRDPSSPGRRSTPSPLTSVARLERSSS